MSLFTIAVKIKKIIRDFLWSGNEPSTSFHWVNWGDICHPKHEGGLGIRCLCEMNEALKAKWLWRFAKEEDAVGKGDFGEIWG